MPVAALDLDRSPGAIRVATFNADMARKGAGVLLKDLADRDPQILNVAEIILRVRPDILLLNEIDHDPQGMALDWFADLLADGVAGLEGIDYLTRFSAPSNTGVPSGYDLDGDGKSAGPGDALGYGRFPGQYAMAVLSRYPLGNARTFRELPWSRVPRVVAPVNPDGTPFWPDVVWASLPLSSKSHWDLAFLMPDGRALHLLASHPTPPVFDGPEDRNGLRNAAEIGFWTSYISGEDWMVDDDGQGGGLAADVSFVIAGDLNNDPEDGDGDKPAIRGLLSHPRMQDPAPVSPGAAEAAAQGGANTRQSGDPARDTADWRDEPAPGNLRADYVLPSRDLTVTGSGVFWPAEADPLHRLVVIKGRERASSDHRLVWVDIASVQE
ncbi:MAG: endonuclease/exonuclease/phosphatase family protein [Pseudomonadota bacterium]